jgi:hypothetical protein
VAADRLRQNKIPFHMNQYGTPGLKFLEQDPDKRVKDLEDCQEDREADAKELKKQWRLLLFGILSTVGTIIVTWLWNLVIHGN